MLTVVLFTTVNAAATTHPDTLLMRKLFSYLESLDTSGIHNSRTYAYQKMELHVKRRNFLLMAVPSMFMVARSGRRDYLSETFEEVPFHGLRQWETRPVCDITTMPHKSKAMPTILRYLTPDLYNVTIFGDHMLSPFCRINKRFYKYRVFHVHDGKVRIKFKPRVANTQLVEGTAVIDDQTGRIVSTTFDGEYDMLRIHLDIVMGAEGLKSLIPASISLQSRFSLLGNRIYGNYKARYDLPQPDSLGYSHHNDLRLMERLRPDTLTRDQQAVYESHFGKSSIRDTTDTASTGTEGKDAKWKKIMWDVIGDNLLNRIKGNFGNDNQGYFRLNPLFNPLYLGYSPRRGITYRFDLRGSWRFSKNSEISARIKLGYSFKLHQLYYSLPINYLFDRKHNGYVKAEVSNGNRITNSSVMEDVRHEQYDSIDWSKYKLDYFHDYRFQLTAHYDLEERLGLEGGVIIHRRSAVDKSSFTTMGLPTTYKSVAPFVELELRPWGYTGPVFTCDYEQSIDGLLGSTMNYARWEFDGQCIRRLPCMRSLSMRAGFGFYMSKGSKSYFLDYTNFRENNVPGGWDDDWSGEFELLNSNWYNASEYYVRANLTYESPLLLASWIPFAGHYVEKERIYVSALDVRQLHPYLELGYGLTTRLFSVGLFMANRNGHFDGAGCRFGFELFRKW